MGRSPSRRRLLMIGLAAATSVATVTAMAPSAYAAPGRHQIAGSIPNWLAKATQLGDAPAGNRVNFGITLKMRDQGNAAALLDDLANPDSKNYGNWLSDAQFNARFAPAASDVSAVQRWLKTQGFQVAKTLPSGMYIEASGSTAQIERTFGTQVKNYKFRGKTLRANSSTLSLPTDAPASVVGAVSGVVGVDQGSLLKEPADTLPGPPAGARFGVPPCSAYYGQKIATDQPDGYGKKQPYAVCGYGPQQYQSAYGETDLLRAGITGRGVTVAITDAYAAPTMLADAQRYNQVHNQPLLKAGQYREITPAADGYSDEADCDPQGWYGEESLDVEAVHAMAPGANIIYVGGANCFEGLDNAWAETIDNHVADIVTNSWGDGTDDVNVLGADYVAFYNQFALKAALTGITVNFSSGDDGDQTAGGTDLPSKSVSFPTDVPYVTSVGGTSVGIGDRGQWLFEYGWQSSYSTLTDGAWAPTPPGDYSSGGGGGTSVIYDQPSYQKGKVPASISKYWGGKAMRTVPDISMPGDPNTGFLVGETQVFSDGTYWDQYRIGGTSLSSPLLAGVIAVADQLTHRSLGFVNPLYYKLLGTPAVHDIVAPKGPFAQVRTNFTNKVDATGGRTFILQTIDVQTTTIHSTPGYDAETGVGSPHGPLFFLALPIAKYLH